jgi:hypothetical protein
MVKVTDCPFPLVQRRKFRDILGRVWEDTYESDYDWFTDNQDACIWFLEQLAEDPAFPKEEIGHDD